MNYKKKKPKYAGGGFLATNAGGIGAGANAIGAILGNQEGALGVLGGAAKGVAMGTALGPPGMIIGGALGAVSSIFGQSAQDKQEAALRKQQAIETKKQQALELDNINKANLSGYSSSGNTTQYYAKGGVIYPQNYEVEKGEVIQGDAELEEGTELASDMKLVGGDKHEQGGTDGMGGERVFSDRTKLTKAGVAGFKSYGIGIKQGATFADAAKKIGQAKGKAEIKIKSQIAPSIRTGLRMLEDHDQALDVLFNMQEEMKPNTQPKTSFATGGTLPGIKTNTINPKNPYSINGLVPAPTLIKPTVKTGTGVNGFNGVLDWLGDNSGQLMNAASYASNLSSINKLDTNVNRSYLPTPNYNYVNRSQPAKNDNLTGYRTTVGALSSGSAAVTGSNAGALYGAMLESNSRINNQENERRDQYDETFSQRTDRINYANVGIKNEASDIERTMLNEKNVALPLAAKNAFLQGYAGNTAMSQRSNLEKQKMLLSAYMNDQTGVLSRIKDSDIKNLSNLPIYKMFKR